MTQRRSAQYRYQPPPQAPLPPLERINETHVFCFTYIGPPERYFRCHAIAILFLWLIFVFGLFFKGSAPFQLLKHLSVHLPRWIPITNSIIHLIFLVKPSKPILKFALLYAFTAGLVCLYYAAVFFYQALDSDKNKSVVGTAYMTGLLFYFLAGPIGQLILIPQFEAQRRKEERMPQRRKWEFRNRQAPLEPLPPLRRITRTNFLWIVADGPPSEAFLYHSLTTFLFWLLFLIGKLTQKINVEVPTWVPFLMCIIFFIFFINPSNLVLNFCIFHAVFVGLICAYNAWTILHDNPTETGFEFMWGYLGYLFCCPLAQIILIPQLKTEIRRNERQARRDLLNRLR
ncbi:unnamed protein product [Caenorhabditis sp. 36 PRJEB53466]|nr:unnamed protein product [Caenorhabditis sp. 36 PRJEB53466]